MAVRKVAFYVLITFLIAGVTGYDASAPLVASNSNSAGAQEPAPEIPTWEQVNSSGFGDPDAVEVSALASFNGFLYAGTSNPAAGARIFRSPDGANWTPVTLPGFGIAHDIRPPAILDLRVFNGYLYASTGQGDGPGQIWRSVNGVTWAPMTLTGFSNPDTVDFTALTEFNSYIYAGASNLVSGAQIWRSQFGDNNTWTQVAPQGLYTALARVTGMAVFEGALYAALDSESVAQIWRSTGGTWTTVVSNGFGDPLTKTTGGMAEFAGYLYAGAGNQNEGAQLWRTSDGTHWEQSIDPGFGNPANEKVETVFVFQNQLYASTKNSQSGLELWRSADGTIWEKANEDGFGDGDNAGTNWSNATAEFLDQLYVGTSNVVDGGELWRMHQSQPQRANLFLPIILYQP